eukprot:gb/GECG01002918.1/.p1 GENE.gb/GECG01002918.1/~~gb/GECG01002918.1/.p1  ORF type:complete len:897 (+),score=177.71 gb/GECG01002918.1/:1-2691(+)
MAPSSTKKQVHQGSQHTAESAGERKEPEEQEKASFSSRVCVKQLPKYVDEQRLKDHFQAKGTITDVKLLRKKDGRSRQLAFVGFRTPEEAQTVVEYFDKSRIDTTPIRVEFAKKIGEDERAKSDKAKALAKQRQHPNAANSDIMGDATKGQASGSRFSDQHLQTIINLASEKGIDIQGEQFREFLSVMKSRKQSKAWGNDDMASEQTRTILDRFLERKDKKGRKPSAKESSKTHEKQGKREELENKEATEAIEDVEEDEPSDEEKEESNDEDKTTAPTQQMSDLDFLRKKMNADFSDSEFSDDDESGTQLNGNSTLEQNKESTNVDMLKASSDEGIAASSHEEGAVNHTDTRNESGDNDDESLIETGRIFVRNLPYSCSSEDVQQFFQHYGEIADVNIPVDSSGRSKGFAYVTFMIPEHAVTALSEGDSSIFQGRILHILPAKPLPSDEEHVKRKQPSTFKEQKEEERKAKAIGGEERKAWNPLFVRNDTLVRSVANRMDMKEGDILDRESDNMAVRMAMAETAVIKETKDFLAEEGVSVTALEKALRGEEVKRSDRTILVKNLPHSAAEASLRSLFGRCGPTLRIVLPPSKVIALIEFEQPSHAKRAFKSMAYARYERVPLYLEWAPVETFEENQDPETVKEKLAHANGEVTQGTDQVKVKESSTEEAPTVERSNTVFVKNLNFSSTEEALRDVFSRVGEVNAVKIPTRANPKTGKQGEPERLSMGFGFVEFSDEAAAKEAIKRLQGVELDDHALELKVSAKTVKPQNQVKRRMSSGEKVQGNSTKLLVKNLAFEATKKDLTSLFGAFGELNSVRLPRKSGGRPRGFGFVEFVSHQEAVNALESLASTHLYGRHLVIEWAKQEDSLEDLQEKAKHSHAKAQGQDVVPKHKKSRVV